jgi:hypothetical protein
MNFFYRLFAFWSPCVKIISMTAHQLAKNLLDGPDLIVCKLTTSASASEVDAFDEISEVEPMKQTFFRDPSECKRHEILSRNEEFLLIF